MLNLGANINEDSSNFVVSYGGIEEIQAWLNQGGELPTYSIYNLYTYYSFNEEFMEKANFLINAGVNLNYQDANGKTALMNIVVNDRRGFSDEVFGLLLSAQPNLNLQDIEGRTAIHLAQTYSNNTFKHIVSSLVKKGAHLNLKNKKGNTLLHDLLSHYQPSKYEDINTILILGAKTKIKNAKGHDALKMVRLKKDKKLRKLIKKYYKKEK